MRDAAVAKGISRREGRGSALLWFGVLGGPIAWFTQLALNYSIEEWFACSPGTGTRGIVLGFEVPSVAFAVTGALAAIALVAGIVSASCYRRIRNDDEISSRARWMALAGIMNSVLYFIIILASFGPPAILGVCEGSP